MPSFPTASSSCHGCGLCSICLSVCQEAGSSVSFVLVFLYFCHRLPVTADLNEIPEAYVEHVSKFLPILRQREFGLGRAADYLQSLCDGTFIRLPLLDVNQFLDCFDLFPSFWLGAPEQNMF